jgi:hypothetical protein
MERLEPVSTKKLMFEIELSTEDTAAVTRNKSNDGTTPSICAAKIEGVTSFF